MSEYLTEDETETFVAMNRATRYIQFEINKKLKEAGLPPLPWYDVLWSIQQQQDEQSRPSAIEADVIFEQSNVHHLGKRLEQAGLIEIRPCEADKRGKVLKITQEGKRVRKRMWDLFGPVLKEMMQDMGKADTRKEFVDAAMAVPLKQR